MHRWRHQVGGVCAALEGALGSGTALVRGSLHFPLPGSWGETECEVAHLLHFPGPRNLAWRVKGTAVWSWDKKG